jgi:heterodisulfide reductase subunit A-like polyferredoxin
MGNPGNTRADTPAAPVGGRRLVVIGSGLAGLTAALEAARAAPGLEVCAPLLRSAAEGNMMPATIHAA